MNPLSFVRNAALSAAVLGLAAGAAQAQTKVKTKTSAGKTKTVMPAAASNGGQTGTGISVANLDRSVSPCDNFFQFASGTWLKNNPIPAAETRWGAFNELADRNQAVERRILEKSAANRTAKPGTNEQKVGDFYATAMDSMAIERAGLKYLQPRLNQISAITDLAGMQRYLADPKSFGTGWYNFGVRQDSKISTQYAVSMGQGGLTLPDRDYYLKDDGRSKAIRAAYQTYQVNVLKMLGDDPAAAEKNAAAVTRTKHSPKKQPNAWATPARWPAATSPRCAVMKWSSRATPSASKAARPSCWRTCSAAASRAETGLGRVKLGI